MTAWLLTSAEKWKKTPEVRRGEIRNWLSLNGIEPRHVPIDCDVIIRENSDGIWVIDFEHLRLTDAGTAQPDPADPDRVWAEPRTMPLYLDPPLYWLTECE